jgi:uncharacterized protein YndB with AHSA1/START domain
MPAMTHPFQITQDLEVDATPEQVWEAIATGPGVDAWFMGHSEIEPAENGAARWSMGGYAMESTVTAWDPPRRFVNTGHLAPDGSFHQFEYRVEARAGGGSAIRYEHSGMLGEDWEAEYEGMRQGDPMYVHKLFEYLTYFPGRSATVIDAWGPQVAEPEEGMALMRHGLGPLGEVALDDRVVLTSESFARIEGVVDWVSPNFLGVRSHDALYRFIYALDGRLIVGHHLFADDVDRAETERSWQAWLDGLAPSSG